MVAFLYFLGPSAMAGITCDFLVFGSVLYFCITFYFRYHNSMKIEMLKKLAYFYISHTSCVMFVDTILAVNIIHIISISYYSYVFRAITIYM